MHQAWLPYALSYGGLLFDLFIVPLLLWRRTRIPAFCLAVCFNLLNATMFRIDVFPWLAIAATTIFLSPGWPRRIVSLFRKSAASVRADKMETPSKGKRILVLTFVSVYIAIQLLVPPRYFLCPGGIEWTYMEHRFSWQMMLRTAQVTTFFYVTDPNNGQTYQVRPEDFLDRKQIHRMGWRPDMVRQFACYLAEIGPRTGLKPLRVEVRMYVSVNGRKPQLFLDPNVDLAAVEPPTWGRPPWLLQIHEPLPPHGEDLSGDLFDSLRDDSN